MAINKQRIEKLRPRLKACYKILHKGDTKRLAYLESPLTSESSPFLKVLSKDLKHRFGKKVRGLSPHTLKRLFFIDDYEDYNEETIINFEIFCREILGENASEKAHKESQVTQSSENEEATGQKPEVFSNSVKTHLKWIIGILMVILLGVFLIKNALPSGGGEKEQVVADVSKEESKRIFSDCEFKPDSLNTYKILIVPFERMGGINGNTNVGKEIERRLDGLNNADSLNLQVHYCKGFIYDKKSDDGDEAQYYTRVMNEHNADQIIYGSKIEMGDLNNPDLTELQVNYCIKPKVELSKKIQYHSQEKFSLVTLSDLYDGVLLGDIEYIIYLNSALAMCNRRDYSRALYYLDLIEDVGLGRFDYSRLRSFIYGQSGMLEIALDYADELVEMKLEPNYLAFSYNYRGTIKTLLGDDGALEDYKKAISIYPKAPEPYLDRAKHKWEVNGDYQGAILEFETSINLFKEKSIKGYLYGGKIALEMKAEEYSDALRDIDKVLTFDNNQPFTYLNKGMVLHKLHRNSEAIEVIAKSIKMDLPNPIEAYRWLGRIYMEMDKTKLALENYGKVLKIYPCQRESLDMSLNIYHKNKEYGLAEIAINECLIKYPRNYELLNKSLTFLELQNCYLEAKDVVQLMYKLSPTVYLYYDEKNKYLGSNQLFDSLSGKPRTVFKVINYSDGTTSQPKLVTTMDMSIYSLEQ